MKISLLMNMKMPTFVGMFIFISREIFMLSLVVHEKSFMTSGPDCADVQIDLSFFWTHMSEGIFAHGGIIQPCHVTNLVFGRCKQRKARSLFCAYEQSDQVIRCQLTDV